MSQRRDATVADRYFVRHVRFMPSGCIEWTGKVIWSGYGNMHVGRSTTPAHRWAWRRFRGPLTRVQTLDHLCRNRRCVNLDHLEPVTMRVNTMRGDAISARNAVKTHCDNGHPFDLFNTYVYPASSPSAGERLCKTCHRERQRRYMAKRRD